MAKLNDKADPPWVEDVLSFWFRELSAKNWYERSAKTDDTVRRRFSSLYEKLSTMPPSMEGHSQRTVLAVVIVLDQFPRNMFRDSPEAFATDSVALALARSAVDQGLDRLLSTEERHCLYLPFQHSEESRFQERSCELYAELRDAEGLDYALRHKKIIDRFGRFPHRNVLLGRDSTVEEEAFLREPGSSF